MSDLTDTAELRAACGKRGSGKYALACNLPKNHAGPHRDFKGEVIPTDAYGEPW